MPPLLSGVVQAFVREEADVDRAAANTEGADLSVPVDGLLTSTEAGSSKAGSSKAPPGASELNLAEVDLNTAHSDPTSSHPRDLQYVRSVYGLRCIALLMPLPWLWHQTTFPPRSKPPMCALMP